MQALKLQSIQQIIEKIRLEIQDYWKKCYYSYEQKERFVAAYDENYNEDLLTKHEEEVEKLKVDDQHFFFNFFLIEFSSRIFTTNTRICLKTWTGGRTCLPEWWN